jgi:uncharacterized protein (TIGR00299 family) protein
VKTLYLDIFSGISGDMFLGALMDMGVDARRLERELKKLKLERYHLHVGRGQKSGIVGTKFEVHLVHDHGGQHNAHHASHTPQHAHKDCRTFADIRKLITKSKLSPWVKARSVAVFRRLAEAEGKVHGVPSDKVHFHEIGAVDSIVDIVGACLALEMLGKPRVLAAPAVEGTGWMRCAHGRFPIPAPATLAILGARGIGLTQCDEPHELVTPTGAALLAEFAESFGPMTGLVAERVGFGLGTRDNKTRPNVLRAVLGKSGKGRGASDETPPPSAGTLHSSHLDWETDRLAVLETNLDDISAEVLGQFVETALAAGALDVFHTPIQMKKNRPGVLLTVLCAEADADKFAELVLRETTAFGVRRTVADRRKLKRVVVEVKTAYGLVTVKLGKLNGQTLQAKPEFESCRQVAAKAGVSLRQVSQAAARAMRIRH